MRTLRLLLVGALLVAPGSSPAASPEVFQGPVPAWVLPRAADLQASSEGIDTSDGMHHLLLDVQVNGLSEPLVTFSRRAWRVLGETGVLHGSTIRIPFDPSFEQLVLHDVAILRDGRRRSVLDLSRVRLIQREERLDAQIYDGTVTALYFIEGVQAGDVVESSYSLSGLNPTFGGLWAEGFEVRWSVPLAENHHLILFPSERPLRWRAHGTELSPRVWSEGGAQHVSWSQSQVEALHLEEEVPGWHDAWPWIQVSEWRSWAAVASWGRELFEPVEPLPQELTARAEAWRSEGLAPAELARRALRLVQDEVRYLGIEFGPKAYLPSQPARVYARRFGDCKDKSVLLVQLLRALGLDAEPALVATVAGRRLPDRLPSPLLFDHAVVRLRLEGTDYWLDATRLHERGPIDRLSVPEWGWALVLAADAQGLVPVEARDFGRTSIEEIYESADYATPALFTVHTRLEGSDADAMRELLAGSSREELQRSYRNYYAASWAGIESLRPLEVEDDQERNRLEMTEVYRIADFWRDGGSAAVREAEVWCLSLDEQLLLPSSVARKMPLRVEHPVHFEQRTILRLPEEWSLDVRDVSVRDQAFRFDHRVRAQPDGRVELVHRYETLRSWVAAERAAQYRHHLERARATLGLSLSTNAGGVAPTLRDLEWPLVLLVLFAFLAPWAGASLVSASGPREPRAPPRRVGGLLIPLSLLVLTSPLLGLVRIGGHSDALRRSTWRELTEPGAATWHRLAELERLSGLVGGALLLGLALMLLSRWLARRREAVAFCLLFLGAALILDVGDAVLRLVAEPSRTALALEALARFLAESLILGLLAAYFHQSTRVRDTFVR